MPACYVTVQDGTVRSYRFDTGTMGATSTSTTCTQYVNLYSGTGGILSSTAFNSWTGTRIITAATANTSLISDGMYWPNLSTGGMWVAPPVDPVRERRRKFEESQRILKARGAIKRALKLMDNVGFGDDIRIFLKGDSIEVSHPDSIFKFVMSKRRANIIPNTIYVGHTVPYHLELYTKTDVHVANLCVYFEDTPILDQVFALTMFIRTGEEEHLLKTANWSSVNKDEDVRGAIMKVYPSLGNRMPTPVPQRVWTPPARDLQLVH